MFDRQFLLKGLKKRTSQFILGPFHPFLPNVTVVRLIFDDIYFSTSAKAKQPKKTKTK